MLAWNARVGYSLDSTRNQPFVAQSGTKSHLKKKKKRKGTKISCSLASKEQGQKEKTKLKL